MLNDFFKLNTPFTTVATLADLENMLKTTDSLKDFLYSPDLVPPIGYGHPKIKFRNKTFTNGSFSKKLIKDVVFINCVFKDCLFIGSRIENCEFHNCKFENVNTHKIEISKTYLKPEYFKNAITDSKYSNIAVHLFQKIYENISDVDQLTIVNKAEYYFRDWSRKHTISKWRNKEIGNWDFLCEITPKTLHYLVGYGIRFEIFFTTYLLVLLSFWGLNHKIWEKYQIKTDLFTDGVVHTKIHSAYFTFYTTTSLGAGEMFPQSNLGIVLAVTQSIIGYIFIGVFLSMLIKKIMK
ncbi:MAG: pentapeptide repeat-containing protein [Bacteroidia bacterium]|nr:pentapeptide repeat-containing protein [Bacteroidia bacterium]